MSLLLTIFVLVFVTELIAWIGQSLLLDVAYSSYLRVFHSALTNRQRALKADMLAKRTEMMQTSAQDHYAKWTKLRRAIDKGRIDLEKLNGELSSKKTSFSLTFNTTIWMLTTGLQFVIGWYHRKSAVFYLPPGWLGPLEWWMALPFAPKGAVSVGVWQMACKRVVQNVIRK